MNIMLIGGGGREHAILRSLRKNPTVETVWMLPGNGAMESEAICTGIGATDLDGIVAFAKEHKVDYAVVAPDDPLVLGCVDRLNELGIPCLHQHFFCPFKFHIHKIRFNALTGTNTKGVFQGCQTYTAMLGNCTNIHIFIQMPIHINNCISIDHRINILQEIYCTILPF